MMTATGFVIQALYQYDEFGRMILSENALGHQQSQQFDVWSRSILSTMANGATTTVTYDDVTTTDVIGNATTEKYDRFGQLVSLYELDHNNNRSTVSQMQYNRINGLLEKQVDANEQATIYAYDVFGQLTSVKNALGE
ncbi:hypothetical protein ACFSJH_17980, partial [Paenibacillus yanchengensis]